MCNMTVKEKDIKRRQMVSQGLLPNQTLYGFYKAINNL